MKKNILLMYYVRIMLLMVGSCITSALQEVSIEEEAMAELRRYNQSLHKVNCPFIQGLQENITIVGSRDRGQRTHEEDLL